jgi:hypothetical protein
MNPILAHYVRSLPTGSHTFGFRWRIPRLRAGASRSSALAHPAAPRWRIPQLRAGASPRLHAGATRFLTFAWSSQQPAASVSGPFARLVMN